MASVIAPGRKQTTDRSRNLESALERGHEARLAREQVVRERNYQLEQENADLRALVDTMAKQLQLKTSEANEAKVAAESAKRAKHAFLSIISHELRTPLNAIIGYSDLLADTATELGAKAMLADIDTVNGAGHHLLELIDDALYLCKIDAANTQLSIVDVDLSVLANELRQAVYPLMKKNANEFILNIQPGIAKFSCDPLRLKKMLQILLGNAAKFTCEGEVSMSIGLSHREEGAVVTFNIEDTGIGMTEAEVARVFLVFEQADNSLGRRYQGAGLGLAIVKKLCELMGAEIAVSSNKGEGSRFTVALPATKV